MGCMRDLKASKGGRPDSGRAETTARPLVTIIVPVLNGEDYLRESLDSILNQTHRPLEVIVMDDGSTDGTAEIVASYGDRVQSVRQPATRGIYANANDGIERARGELVGVFHADDIYLPELVEREVDWLLAHAHAGAVFCSDIFVGADGREIGRLELPRPLRGNRALGYTELLNGLLTLQERVPPLPNRTRPHVGLSRAWRLRSGAVQEYVRSGNVAADRALVPDRRARGAHAAVPSRVTAARQSGTIGVARPRTGPSRSWTSNSPVGVARRQPKQH